MIFDIFNWTFIQCLRKSLRFAIFWEIFENLPQKTLLNSEILPCRFLKRLA